MKEITSDSVPFIKSEYILPMHDDYYKIFAKNSRIKSIENKTHSAVNLTSRILNRQIENYRWTKYLILEIISTTEKNIKMCNQLIERNYPIYKNRKIYKKKSHVSIFTSEFQPDNTNLYSGDQRTGAVCDCHCNLELHNVHSTFNRSKNGASSGLPWKITNSEHRGCYLPFHANTFESICHFYPDLIDFNDKNRLREVGNESREEEKTISRYKKNAKCLFDLKSHKNRKSSKNKSRKMKFQNRNNFNDDDENSEITENIVAEVIRNLENLKN